MSKFLPARRRRALGLAFLACLTTAAAFAYWTFYGTGTGTAAIASLPAPTLTGTGSAEAATLKWTSVTPPTGTTSEVSYYVTRDGGAPGATLAGKSYGDCPTAASPSNALECKDAAGKGGYNYRVVAVWRSWTATSNETTLTITGAAPAELAAQITGTAQIGEKLSASQTHSATTPVDSAKWQWERCNASGESCTLLSGATGSTYTVVKEDAEHTLRVTVTACNLTGCATATSPQTTAVPSPPANTSPPLIEGVPSWYTHALAGSPDLTAISCAPSTTTTAGLCMATSDGKTAYLSDAPGQGGSSWQPSAAYSAGSHLAVACPSTSLCISTTSGQTNIAAITGTTATWTNSSANNADFTADVCPSSSFCLHTDYSSETTEGVVYATKPAESSSWGTLIDNSVKGYGLACAPLTTSTSGLCVDVGAEGRMSTSTDPSSTWTTGATIDGTNKLTGVSCPTTSFCAAIDNAGNILTSTKPLEATAWMSAAVASATELTGISCPTASFCVAVDSTGTILTSTNPTGGAGAWQAATATLVALHDVWCASSTLCVAVGASGTLLVYSATSPTTPQEEGRLRTTTGSWHPEPSSYTYQWERCNTEGEACSAVSGSTEASYKITAEDDGHTLRSRITAHNSAGSTTAQSAPTGIVAAWPPENTSSPKITGTAALGHTLAASSGSWTHDPSSYTYQWLRCNASGGECSAIAAATHSTYTLTEADVTRTIRVKVTALNTAGATSVESAATAKIVAGPPANTSVPTIECVPFLGKCVGGLATPHPEAFLSATAGTWTNEPSYAYQWLVCNTVGTECTATETGSGYVIPASAAGHTIRVEVTATNAAGSATARSAPTGVVLASHSQTVASGVELTTVSCIPASTSCGVGDKEGGLFGSTDAGATTEATWSAWAGPTHESTTVKPAAALACPSSSLCALGAGESIGGELGTSVYRASTLGGEWANAMEQAPLLPTDAVTCPSTSFCAAAGYYETLGLVYYSTSPDSATSWETLEQEGEAGLTSIDCVSSSFCAAANAKGDAYIAEGSQVTKADWPKQDIDGTSALTGIACASTTRCVAIDAEGRALFSAEPTEAGSWVKSDIDGTTKLTGVTCVGGTTCVAVDGAGNVFISSDSGETWTKAFEHEAGLTSVSCASGTLCAATDVNGAVFTFEASPPLPPQDTTLPYIECFGCILSEPYEEDLLIANKGAWANGPTGYTYQWLACDETGTSCSPIVGATGETYALSASDLGHTLRVKVTATNAAGSASVESAPTGIVLAALPENTNLPTITGTPALNDTLTATSGAWAHKPTSYAYAWERCNASGESCATISGATGTAYKPVEADEGHELRVKVTATNAVGPVSATSKPTAKILAGPPALTSAPTVTAKGQEWSPAVTIASSEWFPTKGLSCPTASFCAGVTNEGRVVTSTNPTNQQSWVRSDIDGTTKLNGISCPTASFCAAVDVEGGVLTSTKPTEVGSWTRTDIDVNMPLTGISCPTVSFCAATTEEGGVLTTTTPTKWEPATVWFVEHGSNVISRITLGSELTETHWLLPEGSKPWGITPGPDGDLWFTDRGTAKIGRITPAGAITEWSVPAGAVEPTGIATGPEDHALWFTEYLGSHLGKITTSGTITETGGPPGFAITPAPNDELAYTEFKFRESRVVRANAQGAITATETFSKGLPNGITVGPEGLTWFTLEYLDSLGAHTPENTWFTMSLTSEGYASDVAAGMHGELWVANGVSGEALVSVSATSHSVIKTCPGPSESQRDVIGPDGDIWYTASGRVQRTTVNCTDAGVWYASEPIGITDGPGWSPTGRFKLEGISCASATTCATSTYENTSRASYLLTSTMPNLDSIVAWHSHTDETAGIIATSCASTSFCAAGDDSGNILTTGTPAEPASWTPMSVDGTKVIRTISCPSATFCMAADGVGNALASSKPTEAASWTKTKIDGTYALSDVSCASSWFCAAVDGHGQAMTYAPTFTATTGSWANEPASYAYQWERCSATGAECVTIPGATKASYQADGSDENHTLRVKITATNAAGSTSATSEPTAIVK